MDKADKADKADKVDTVDKVNMTLAGTILVRNCVVSFYIKHHIKHPVNCQIIIEITILNFDKKC